jgi:hypothetical protein
MEKYVPKARKQAPPAKPSRIDLWISAAIVLATLVLYAQVRDFGFVNYDDPDYATNNRARIGAEQHYQSGLALAKSGELQKAAAELEQALRIKRVPGTSRLIV